MKRRGGVVLWLVYLDSSVPRSRGRLLPKNLAVARPTIQEVAQALDRLGYKYEVYREKKYPALWFEDRVQGYFLVFVEEEKRKLAEKVSQIIRQLRGE